MLEQVARFLHAHAMLPSGSVVLVGVSGGIDSVALLRALWLLQDQLGVRVEAAHFHHGIRVESGEEQLFVEELCRELAVPLHLGCADVPALARASGQSLEVAARQARHRFFRQAMAECGAERLALAHHRDDQAETVLLRLIRGAGADGLAAMAPVEETGIVRPFLCVGRAEIRAWCEQNGFTWREDPSNADTSIPRNWVRHVLLPMAEERLNPQATGALCRAADLLREDSRFLNGLANAALTRAVELPGGGASAPTEDLAGLPWPVQSRALRQLARRSGLAADVELCDVAALASLLGEAKTGRRLDLGGGAVAIREAGMLAVLPALPEQSLWEPVPLGIPGETEACGGVFRCRLLDAVPAALKEHPVAVQHFDADCFPTGVVARSRAEGDRFHPLGAPGGKKLKDHLIDRKVARYARNGLPLLASGAEVLWVVGVGISDKVRVTAQTTRVLQIEFVKKEKGL